ncbi:MAG: hypothetical protein AAGB26_08620 [Planctomycetota bacterium]
MRPLNVALLVVCSFIQGCGDSDSSSSDRTAPEMDLKQLDDVAEDQSRSINKLNPKDFPLANDKPTLSSSLVAVHYVYPLDGVVKKEIITIDQNSQNQAIQKLREVIESADEVQMYSPVGVGDQLRLSVYVLGDRGIYHEFAVYYLDEYQEWAAGYGFSGSGAIGGYGYGDDQTEEGVVQAFQREYLPMLLNGDTPLGRVIPLSD